MELWELAAREAIRELVARYAQHADRGRFDDLVALFAEDGVLSIADREPLRGRDAIQGFLTDTRASLAHAGSPRRLRHHVASHTIALADQRTATGAAYFMVVTSDGPDHWGWYRDRYVARGGAWLFAERQVRVEGSAADSRRPARS